MALHNNKRIKGSIQQDCVTFVNTYAPNIGAPKYIKQILTKEEIHSNIITGDFNSSLTLMDRKSGK